MYRAGSLHLTHFPPHRTVHRGMHHLQCDHKSMHQTTHHLAVRSVYGDSKELKNLYQVAEHTIMLRAVNYLRGTFWWISVNIHKRKTSSAYLVIMVESDCRKNFPIAKLCSVKFHEQIPVYSICGNVNLVFPSQTVTKVTKYLIQTIFLWNYWSKKTYSLFPV